MTEHSFSAEDFWPSQAEDREDSTSIIESAEEPAQAPRRAGGAAWMDEAHRPRVFTPPPSRSAVQAHRTTADVAGQPLPPRARARLERALGGDLSSARVHMQSAARGEDERAIAVAQVLTRLLNGR